MDSGPARAVAIVRVDGARWTTGWTVALVTLGAIGGTVALGADRWGVTLCAFKSMTGYACFTCGTTRALGALARLDLEGALAVQPLVALSAIGALAWGLADLALRPSARRLDVRPPRTLAGWFVVLLALVANWAYLLRAGV
jgi:hypothetical protein